MNINRFFVIIFCFFFFFQKVSWGMQLDIITIEDHPEGALRKKAENLTFPLSGEDQAFVQAMKDKVCELGGVGLAANQVNSLKRVAVVYIPEDSAGLKDVEPCKVYALINPQYKPYGDVENKIKDFEGCYSVPKIMGEVPRYSSIEVSYESEQGKTITRIVHGFEARVLQHEIDHLDGILFTDRFTPECRRGDPETIRKLQVESLSPEKRALLEELRKKGKPLGDD